MNYEQLNRFNMYKKIAIITGIILFLLCGFICITVEGKTTFNSTLNVTEITDTSIKWNYAYLTANRPIGATLDGKIIEGFKTDLVYNFTATDLQPNSTYEFCLFGEATSNCEEATTTNYGTNQENILAFVLTYIILIACIICLYVGLYVPFVSFLAFIFAVIGITQSLNNSFTMGTIYVIVIIASIFVAFRNGE